MNNDSRVIKDYFSDEVTTELRQEEREHKRLLIKFGGFSEF